VKGSPPGEIVASTLIPTWRGWWNMTYFEPKVNVHAEPKMVLIDQTFIGEGVKSVTGAGTAPSRPVERHNLAAEVHFNAQGQMEGAQNEGGQTKSQKHKNRRQRSKAVRLVNN